MAIRTAAWFVHRGSGMTTMTRLFCALCVVAGAACSDSATDIGDATVNGQMFHVSREGPMPAAGVSTQLVFKAMDGSKPDSIMAWVGVANVELSQKVLAVYDPGDGDFDDDVICPSPLPAGAKIWFDVTVGATTTTGSVDIK